MPFGGTDLKGLFVGRNSETLIFGLSIIGMFGALAAGAHPGWSVFAGFGIPFVYCGYRLLMTTIKMHEAKAAAKELAVKESVIILDGRATDAEKEALDAMSAEAKNKVDTP